MVRIMRRLGVSGAAWIAIFAIGGAALAGALSASDPVLTISPESVLDGHSLDSGQAFDMSLHVEGDPEMEYPFSVTYGGDAGSCAGDVPSSLTTNAEGKVSWLCVWQTPENTGEEALSGSATFDVGGVQLVANLEVRPAQQEDEQEEEVVDQQQTEQPEATNTNDNHGACVSGWGHHARSEGLHSRFYGQFVSMIARSDCQGFDETEFDEELQAALEAQAAAAEEASADGASTSGAKGKAKPAGGKPS